MTNAYSRGLRQWGAGVTVFGGLMVTAHHSGLYTIAFGLILAAPLLAVDLLGLRPPRDRNGLIGFIRDLIPAWLIGSLLVLLFTLAVDGAFSMLLWYVVLFPLADVIAVAVRSKPHDRSSSAGPSRRPFESE